MNKYLIILLCCYNSLFAQQQPQPDKEGSYVNWMSLKEAMDKIKTQPKPIIMDFYTDWCGWCKTMMKTTYANPDLANYINSYFYPVKFNAEGKDTVEFLGEKYIPVSKEPRVTHPFAEKMLNGKLMYPTTLFMNGYDKDKNEFKINMIANGYLDQQKIEPILIFVLENAGRNASYDDFREQFMKAFYDSTTAEKLKKIKWQEPKVAFEEKLPKSKKTLVIVNTPWCSSGKVMKMTSFIDSTVEKYLLEKFKLVDFNPETKDTITYKDQKLFNPGNPQMPFHQLALILGKNSITFPSLIVLDENMEVMDDIPSYVSPRFLNEIIHYYGDNINKTKSWQDFMKERNPN